MYKINYFADKQKEKAALPNGRTAILDGINTTYGVTGV